MDLFNVNNSDIIVLVAAFFGGALVVLVGAYFWVKSVAKGFQAELVQVNAEKERGLQLERETGDLVLDKRITEVSAEFREKIASQASLITSLENQLTAKNDQLVELKSIEADYIQLKTRLEDQQASIEAQTTLLEQTKVHLFKEFELSAAKLFEEKQKSFTQTNKQSLEGVVGPFKEQIKDFHKRIEEVHSQDSSQRNQLVGKIGELQKQALQIGEDANNLAAALKGDNKFQGDWGEVILERLLEESGLEKGREYDAQTSLVGEEGQRLRPDVVIHLPDKKDIVVDSKVSLLEYQNYVVAELEADKEKALKRHLDSIKTHVKGLSLKRYENIPGIRSLDFVFLFIPIEGAYLAALQALPSLFKEAFEKNIVIVSPSNLMVALRTIETIWRYEKQNTNAEKIANSAGKLYDQFVLFLDSMEAIGASIEKANDAYHTSLKRLNSGRGNLFKRVEDLKKLGAKTSRKVSDKTATQLELPAENVRIENESDANAVSVERQETSH